MPEATDPQVGKHFRSRGDGVIPGVYRVVGVDGKQVTLLRVTDGEGRRRATGQLESVVWPSPGFDPAANPDAGVRPSRWLRDRLQGAVWAVRMVTGQ